MISRSSLAILALLAGCPSQKASINTDGPAGATPVAGDVEPAAEGLVTVDAELANEPVMQHPVNVGPPEERRRVSYLKIDGAQTVVYADTTVRCPRGEARPDDPDGATPIRPGSTPVRVRLTGHWTTITASKFGREGTERQFVAKSWECLP